MFTQGWLPRLESESLKKDFTNFRNLPPKVSDFRYINYGRFHLHTRLHW